MVQSRVRFVVGVRFHLRLRIALRRRQVGGWGQLRLILLAHLRAAQGFRLNTVLLRFRPVVEIRLWLDRLQVYWQLGDRCQPLHSLLKWCHFDIPPLFVLPVMTGSQGLRLA